jgi:hypothetical protein
MEKDGGGSREVDGNSEIGPSIARLCARSAFENALS